MKKLIVKLLIADAILFILLSLFANKKIVLSFEVAFLSSAFIILASFNSYKNSVQKRLALIDGEFFEQDVLDKIDDRFGLYEESNSNTKTPQEIIKEEKKNLKNSKNLKESLKESKSFFNPLKLGAYLFLFLGFLFLNSNGYLNTFAYLISLAIPITIAIWSFLGELNVR